MVPEVLANVATVHTAMTVINGLTRSLVFVPWIQSGFVACPRAMCRASWETCPCPSNRKTIKAETQ